MTAPNHKRPWTETDKRMLGWLWENCDLPAICKRLGRSAGSVWGMADKLGLRLGRPNGYESVASAAERCGVARTTIERIVRWYGLAPRRAYVAPDKKRTRMGLRTHLALDPTKVDEAVTAWCECEPLATAARARGIDRQVLPRMLRERGIALERYGTRGWRRIPSALADELAAEYRKSPPKRGPKPKSAAK